MGFSLADRVDRRTAVKALINLAFAELGCVHLEMMDRHVTLRDLDGLDVDYRMLRGFEIELGHSFSSTSISAPIIFASLRNP